ncbi:MAG: Xaa-Pro dipeptidase [Wenzhouxiangellaceae bacterium]|nr:Xaa-Pro dipeptidase [Wenzhouxiangellaceae bacterium]
MTAKAFSNARERLFGRHIEALTRETERALAQTGFDRLLIHSGHSRPRFQDDNHPPFRAHPYFVHWLPLPQQADSLLEIAPGARPRLWLCSPDDYWHAAPPEPEGWWAEHFEVESVAEPEAWLHALAERRASALIGDRADFTTLGEHAELDPPALLQQLDEARTLKTDWQIACMAEANRRALAGHRAAAEAFAGGGSELDIHLAYLAAAGADSESMPYNNIVALNEHCAVLHYQRREAARPDGHRSFLIDAGADVYGLAADVTRTHAAGPGLFADLVAAMDELQQRLAARMQTGRSYVDLHFEAHRGVADLLHRFGVCRMTIDAMLEAGLTRTFLPHGLGHFLGVQVHDVAGRVAPDGCALPPPKGHAALRLTRRLESGNVLTVEPGLYFIPSLLAELRDSPLSAQVDWDVVDELLPFGGVRIEDNVVVAPETPRNLTREAEAG